MRPNACISSPESRGLSDSGLDGSPWIAFDVSQTMQTLQPFSFNLAKCPWTAAISSSTDRTRSSVEYHPEMNFSP